MESNTRTEEFKKNNEHKSDSKDAHEDMISREKACWREQRNSKEEMRKSCQEICKFQKSAEKLIKIDKML